MSQSLSNILVHLIFSTKHRQPLILPHVEPELHGYIVTTLQNMKCHSLQVNGTLDHLHILFRLARTMSVSDVVQEVKTSTSKWIKQKDSDLREFGWQDGYGEFSVSQSKAAEGIRYIKGQKEHHRIRSFQDEFREFLRKYEVEFDEKYVWD